MIGNRHQFFHVLSSCTMHNVAKIGHCIPFDFFYHRRPLTGTENNVRR